MPARTPARLLAAAGIVLFLLAAGAGTAAAKDLEVKATSPPYGRVVVVPDAVSVTFTGDIKDDGAAVVVAGPGGVTFGARTEVVDDTLREYLDPGPAGDYTVTWAATGKGGEKLSGTFSFGADQARADYTPSPSPSPSPGPSPSSSPAPAVVPAPPAHSPPGGGGHGFEVPRIVVPVGLAALLVAASGLIAATNRRPPISSRP